MDLRGAGRAAIAVGRPRGAGKFRVPAGGGCLVIEILQMAALQRGAQDAFDAAHHAAIFVSRQGKGVARAGGPAGATDAVDIGIGRVRDVIVDDMGYLGDVDAAGRYVGGHQDLVGAVPEAVQGGLAPVLGQVALQGGRAVAGLAQLFPQALGTMFGAGEDQHGFGIGVPQQFHQHGGLEVLGYRKERVADRGGRGRATHLDGHGLVKRFLGQMRNLTGHGGRKQERLALGGRLGDNASNVRQKAHVEHLVGFVQNEDFQS